MVVVSLTGPAPTDILLYIERHNIPAIENI